MLDVSMPEMGGLELTQAIRQREQRDGHQLPIIGMTANAMKVLYCCSAGAPSTRRGESSHFRSPLAYCIPSSRNRKSVGLV